MRQEEINFARSFEKFTQADVKSRERRKTFRPLGTTIRILSNNRCALDRTGIVPGRLRQREEKKRGEKKKRCLKRVTGEGHFARARCRVGGEPVQFVYLLDISSLRNNSNRQLSSVRTCGMGRKKPERKRRRLNRFARR